MPKLTASNPTYRRHRASGQAIVTLSGRDFYLGPYGTAASRREFDRVTAEWLARGRQAVVSFHDLTVAEVAARFLRHAAAYYRSPDDARKPTGEVDMFKAALRPVVRLYGRSPAAEFGPLAMQAARDEMVRLGWSRNFVNAEVRRVRAVFKWAASQQLIPVDAYHGLTTITGLRAGRTAARECDPVKPVAEATVEQTIEHLSRIVAAMVRVQLLCGMRPAEVCALRTADIDRSGNVWTASLAKHKTAYRGHARTIFIGPQAQDVLTPFLNLAKPDQFLFSPAAAVAESNAARHASRVTPACCGNVPGSNRVKRPRKVAGDAYTAASYADAIGKACDRAFPPPPPLARRDGETIAEWQCRLTPAQAEELKAWRRANRWAPNRLRHSCATKIRGQFNLESAAAILGHRTLLTTQIYAERSGNVGRTVAMKIG